MTPNLDAIEARKPPEGKPCNHCGLCCILEQCAIGKELIPAPAGECCSAIGWDRGEKFYCGLVVNPERFDLDDDEAAAIALLLGIGKGCCSTG